MNEREQRRAAAAFAHFWKGKGYEKGQSQSFWLALLRDVFDVSEPEKFISFENQVQLDHTSFIDGFIPSTHVLIEQKGIGKDLKKPIRQSDGTYLTPFQQAKRYSMELPYTSRPRWIVVCNFEEFHVYDMERPSGQADVIRLADLEHDYYRLNFLVDNGAEETKKEADLSFQAGKSSASSTTSFFKDMLIRIRKLLDTASTSSA